ncbi:long-chain-fatty-acid--CoA ligase [Fodinicola acaciae]|uniref:long-chain-fatty-acid--CoA ligase n=1 Tax=Fodinicola acaciae TaxID=2681555 RepID=UPI001FE84402|nr:long-chain-fatty-acid--CoA ligase [Fodinicola acaciae]
MNDLAAVNAGRRMSFAAQLSRAARVYGDNIAFSFADRQQTFAELDERVTKLASALAAQGVTRGDRVALLMRNRLEFPEALLAPLRLGAIAVPINFRLVAGEISYILADSGARALIVDAALATTAAAAKVDSLHAVLVTDGGEGEFGPDALPYEETVAAAPATPLDIDVPESDAAFIIYTSGTTGRPKGAVLTHFNLLMAHLIQGLATGGVDRKPGVSLLAVPMFHIAGLSLSLSSMITGSRVVLYSSPTFVPEQIVDLFEKERVTSCFFVPSQWAMICAVPGVRERDLALERISWGAAVAPPSVLQAMAETFPNAPAYCAFGQTEMSPTTCLLRREDAIEKMGSVGTPLPGIEVRIVDEFMKDVPRGEVGEIVYRGPTTMREYWNKPEATAEAFAGGWFHSGDLVRMDDDGFIWVVDRKKDMIISGGENIYCAEVEAAIDSHPDVADVSVVGRADQRWGQIPVAFVVARDPASPPTLEKLTDHLRERLASYKRPKDVIVVDALPRNASGKVQKFVLRERVNG